MAQIRPEVQETEDQRLDRQIAQGSASRRIDGDAFAPQQSQFTRPAPQRQQFDRQNEYGYQSPRQPQPMQQFMQQPMDRRYSGRGVRYNGGYQQQQNSWYGGARGNMYQQPQRPQTQQPQQANNWYGGGARGNFAPAQQGAFYGGQAMFQTQQPLQEQAVNMRPDFATSFAPGTSVEYQNRVAAEMRQALPGSGPTPSQIQRRQTMESLSPEQQQVYIQAEQLGGSIDPLAVAKGGPNALAQAQEAARYQQMNPQVNQRNAQQGAMTALGGENPDNLRRMLTAQQQGQMYAQQPSLRSPSPPARQQSQNIFGGLSRQPQQPFQTPAQQRAAAANSPFAGYGQQDILSALMRILGVR